MVNPGTTTSLGHNPGYEVILGHGATSPCSTPRIIRSGVRPSPARRSGSPATTRRRNMPAGPWPNQAQGGDGLPRFVAQGRSIDNTDLVVSAGRWASTT